MVASVLASSPDVERHPSSSVGILQGRRRPARLDSARMGGARSLELGQAKRGAAAAARPEGEGIPLHAMRRYHSRARLGHASDPAGSDGCPDPDPACRTHGDPGRS